MWVHDVSGSTGDKGNGFEMQVKHMSSKGFLEKKNLVLSLFTFHLLKKTITFLIGVSGKKKDDLLFLLSY